MIRAVIDTNILVRAIIKPTGTVGPIITHLRDGDYVLLYSEETLGELLEVLNRPRIRDKYGLHSQDILAVGAFLRLKGELVRPKRRITICRDPKDNMFLEVAVYGRANALVSGDEDLLTLHPFQGIPIISPSEFLHRFLASKF